LPTRSKLVVQGPGENAGIIDIGDGWACAFKIEIAHHPSFIEPFQGATTGVRRNPARDIFTMAQDQLAVMDSLASGRLRRRKNQAELCRRTARAAVPKQTISKAELHKNHSVMEGVVSGVASYGNCFGVPNLGGENQVRAQLLWATLW